MVKKTSNPAATKAPSKGAKATKKPAKADKPKKAAAPRGPLARVKALYESKTQLVDSLVNSLRTGDGDDDALKERLRKASNQQLLRLATVAETVKKTYGSRDKLIGALTKALNKAKDKD